MMGAGEASLLWLHHALEGLRGPERETAVSLPPCFLLHDPALTSFSEGLLAANTS